MTDEEKLQEAVTDIQETANELGLQPNEVNYWLVDHDEMNQLSAYQGFPVRYPHWQWGMNYVKQKKKDKYFGGKIFELVHHDEPANAFLQESNDIIGQKSVIAHVEAHSDFFANNQFFDDNIDATSMMEQHANVIRSYYEDPNINKEEVEAWIDAVLCLEDMIDPKLSLTEIHNQRQDQDNDDNAETTKNKIEELDISEEIKEHVFSEIEDEDENETEEMRDLLQFMLKYGHQYNDETERAEEYESWQRNIIEMIRKEWYYFQPQKQTKIMNEGWAAYWESLMMMQEGHTDKDEVFDYAEHHSKILESNGSLNPYFLGKELWTHLENRANRREVVNKLLRVDGITWRNFHQRVDFDHVRDVLDENRDMDVPAERNYSLLRNENKTFIEDITLEQLKQLNRYVFDTRKYNSVDEALADVNYEAGWEKMREAREIHNDITFIDAYLTEEFIKNQNYFAYEYDYEREMYRVSGRDLDSVKKKLLLSITNGGKPVIKAVDNNYNNSGHLLLHHQFNGIPLDIEQAKDVLKQIYRIWGRPVFLKTVDIDEGEDEKIGLLIKYDGESTSERETDRIDDILNDDISYDTRPEKW